MTKATPNPTLVVGVRRNLDVLWLFGDRGVGFRVCDRRHLLPGWEKNGIERRRSLILVIDIETKGTGTDIDTRRDGGMMRRRTGNERETDIEVRRKTLLQKRSL
jgi:hypothetical protein